MKVIFLDIDGVLNVIPQGRDKYGSLFHSHLVNNLRSIIEATGASLVISSTWRYSGVDIIRMMWLDRNLPGKVIGITPFGSSIHNIDRTKPHHEQCERGYEIAEWLQSHLNVESYVIIDDDNDMLVSQQDYFVQTSRNTSHEDCVDFGYGLTKICAEKAIKILNN